jgi:hypothetical protein
MLRRKRIIKRRFHTKDKRKFYQGVSFSRVRTLITAHHCQKNQNEVVIQIFKIAALIATCFSLIVLLSSLRDNNSHLTPEALAQAPLTMPTSKVALLPLVTKGIPTYTHSWYINDPIGATMYNLGQNDGQRDNMTCTNAIVMLDFGQIDNNGGTSYSGYGTRDFAGGNPFISNSDIEIAAENYASGWYAYTSSCPRLKLVIGSNNYAYCPSGGTCNPSTGGAQWGSLISNIQGWLDSTNRSWKITAWAGSDMEQPSGTQAWECALRTRQFVDGFKNNNPASARFINYGTAWVPYPQDGSCWNAFDVFYVSYVPVPNWPLPEIYFPSATDSWINIRMQYYMQFLGVLATCTQPDLITGDSCSNPSGWFTPDGGWKDLWNKLIANQVSQESLDYSTNIKFQGQ